MGSAHPTSAYGQCPSYVRATFSVSLNPETVKQIDAQISQWQKNLSNCGLDPVQASIVYLAAEGLWATEMFEINTPNQTLRKQILKRLLDITHEAR
jgi:hypothetical protein